MQFKKNYKCYENVMKTRLTKRIDDVFIDEHNEIHVKNHDLKTQHEHD